MKKRKIIPYIFLSVLVAIVIFMLGLRHGQRVEKTNKEINFILSIKPTQKPEKSPLPTTTYALFTHEACGIAFMKPSYLEIKEESTTSAILSSQTGEKLEITCFDSKKTIQDTDQKNATTSAITLDDQKFTGTKKELDKSLVELTFTHSRKQLSYTFIVHKNLIPIFEQTFKFLP